MRSWKTLLLPGLLGVLVFALGCGGKKTAGLSGNVTLNGTPVKWAQVIAYNDKEEAVSRTTAIDGRYELSDIPPGNLTLVVQTHSPDGQPLTNPQRQPPREGEKTPPVGKKDEKAPDNAPQDVEPVPLKYNSVKESGLKVTVAAGSTTTFDIAMTGKGEKPSAPPPKLPGTGQPPIPPPPGVPPPPK